MAKKKPKTYAVGSLQGFKFFRHLAGLTEHLHHTYIDPKHPNKRVLHYDQYLSLILLGLFSPVCDSLRMVQKATEFRKVRKALNIPRFGRSTLSDAAKTFDPDLLKGIIEQLSQRVPETSDAILTQEEIGQIVTAIDGSWLPGIVTMLWADFRHNSDKRAAKAHVQFELAKGVPVAGRITDANTAEHTTLRAALRAGRLYVLDRGYADYGLLWDILGAQSSFVARLQDNAVLEVVEERLLDDAALKAGVVRDALVRLGGKKTRDKLPHVVRIVEVECRPHRKPSGKTARGGPEQGETILIATDRADLPAEAISILYQHRWAIEIFFRFFKHILGCRHLFSHDENGLQLQLYAAIIATLLIAVYTGLRPTKTVLRLVQFHLIGWATRDELTKQLNQQKTKAAQAAR